MILVDSSVWVDFLRGSGRGGLLARLLDEGAGVACSEPVLMEVLAGARTADEYARLRAMLTGVSWIPVDPAADFEAAASIYAMSRAVGVTPRGLVDCLIAAIALRADADVLSSDVDFERLGEVVPLRFSKAH